MTVPLWSAVTLAAELVVTGCVYYIIWKAYSSGRFFAALAAAVLAYEILFNISYMASRLLGSPGSPLITSPYETAIAAFHGIFSLVMFVALLAFFGLAWRAYRSGKNFFREHRTTTIAFSVAWAIAILSGVALFVSLYIV